MPSRLLFLLPHSRVVDVIYCRCHAYAYAMGTEEAERYRCTRTHNSPTIRVECVCVLAMIFFVLRCAYSRRYVQYSLFFPSFAYTILFVTRITQFSVWFDGSAFVLVPNRAGFILVFNRLNTPQMACLQRPPRRLYP